MVEAIRNDKEIEALYRQFETITEKNDEKDSSARVELFFSFDIVDSTAYKEKNPNWVNDLTGQIYQLKGMVDGEIRHAQLWRVIGDEIVFTYEISNVAEIYRIVDRIFYIVNYNKLKDEKDPYDELAFDIKAAAWLAPVKKWSTGNVENEEDNILIDYELDSRPIINEFLGPDIDTGFRIKKETEKRRLVVSFELAELLNQDPDYSKRLKIITYKVLKGVWGGKPYPIIWYYDEDKMHDSFENSFTYYESIASDFAKEYFRLGEPCSDAIPPHLMRDTGEALEKICTDLQKKDRIKYILSLMKESNIDDMAYNQSGNVLELHFAAICCDLNTKSIMLVKRSGRKHLDGRWEFGCSKSDSKHHLEDTIKTSYKRNFGLDIEIIRDTTREEKRAKPIALYEYTEKDKIHKGVIVVAKVVGGKDSVKNCIDNYGRYSDVKWITQDQVESFDEKAVSDLQNSMKKVFDNWDDLF